MSLFTYSDLQYVATCYGAFYESEVYLSSNKHSELFLTNPGAAHMDKIKIRASSSNADDDDEPMKVQVFTNFSK